MKTVNDTIELNTKETKILEFILNSEIKQSYKGNILYKKIFAAHGRYPDLVRNTFLYPLLEYLQSRKEETIFITVS